MIKWKWVTLPLVTPRMLTIQKASQKIPDASLSATIDGGIFEMDDYSTSCSPTHFPHPNKLSRWRARGAVLVVRTYSALSRRSQSHPSRHSELRSTCVVHLPTIDRHIGWSPIIIRFLRWLPSGWPRLPELSPFTRDDSVFRSHTSAAPAAGRHYSAGPTTCSD